MIFLFALLACSPKHAPVGVAEGVAPGIVVASRPSGVVYEGVFTDEMHAFSLPVAEGWVAVPGPEVGLMRVRLNHVATGTRVEVWAFKGGRLEPHQREGCTWGFQAKGRSLFVSSETLVATCVPDDPLGRRVYGTIFQRSSTTFQIEVEPPNDALLEGHRLAEALLSGMSW
jgi:hypothetical protein